MLRMTACVVGIFLAVTACSDPPVEKSAQEVSAPLNDASDAPGMSDLEAALRTCDQSQGAVYDALQGSDRASAIAALESAKQSCSSASRELRRTPLPGHPSTAPDGVAKMAEGLGKIEDAVRILDTAPTAAKKKARLGLEMYQAGLKLLG